MLDPDDELVKRCQSDDPEVFEKAFFEIYKKYGERIYNTSFRILGNSDDALDVTQDAFINIFRKIDQFREDSRFFTWFYRIVVNLCIDRKRKLLSTKYVSESLGNEIFANIPDVRNPTTEDLAKNEHLEHMIQKALMRLSPVLRPVVVLRYIEGFSYAEIAETLECSVGTVKSRMNRAHRNLEVILKPEIDLASVDGEST